MLQNGSEGKGYFFIDGLQAFARKSKDKNMVAILVPLMIDANETPTLPREAAMM